MTKWLSCGIVGLCFCLETSGFGLGLAKTVLFTSGPLANVLPFDITFACVLWKKKKEILKISRQNNGGGRQKTEQQRIIIKELEV